MVLLCIIISAPPRNESSLKLMLRHSLGRSLALPLSLSLPTTPVYLEDLQFLEVSLSQLLLCTWKISSLPLGLLFPTAPVCTPTRVKDGEAEKGSSLLFVVEG